MTETAPEHRTFRAIVEQPTLRRVVEHLTLVTLLMAVSLYAIGQFQTWRYIHAFGIPTTGIERGWETYVFNGAVTVLNLLLNLGAASLRWILPLFLLLGAWLFWRRVSGPGEGPRRVFARALANALVACSYIFLLLMLGVSWGIQSARMTMELSAPAERYVVTPEAQALLPAGFNEANAKGALRFVASGTDSVFLFDPERKQTYALPHRLIVCRVYEPQH